MEGIGRDRRLLIVEDEHTVLVVIQLFLETQGFEVEAVETLADAKRALDARAFDLILADKNLPDGTGMDIAKRFVGTESETQIVVMTGYSSIHSAVEAIKYGVADYILKPFELEELLARLNRVLEMKELRSRNRRLLAELREKNEALQRDPLTKLYNHTYFVHALQEEVIRGRREGRELGLLFLDVDRFEALNHSSGHAMGDRVLCELADVLRATFAEVGSCFRLQGTEIAARHCGDELAVLLPGMNKARAAARAEALRRYLQGTDFAGAAPAVTVSIGVASFPGDGECPAAIVCAAEAALYAAKSRGGNRVVRHSPGLQSDGELEQRAARLDGVDRIISGRAFEMVYQPIVDARVRSVVGYEALCRPRDEIFRTPRQLIEAAEATGKIGPLGRVLRDRCWGDLEKLDRPGLLFVNIQPAELRDPDLCAIDPLKKRWKGRVVFEINGAASIRAFEEARSAIGALHSSGIRVALEGLGSGYAGLSCLSALEPDFLKLRVESVERAAGSPRSARCLEHLLELADDTGISVIAAGVERRDQLASMRELGIHLVQGYFFGEPGATFAGLRRPRARPQRPREATG